MNEHQVNSRLYSKMQEKKVQHSSAIKQQWSTIVVCSMVELDHQRSAAKTLVNKMGLDTFVLFNI